MNQPYKTKWTEFEVQSLAFGILRKNLYPHYLVRGEYKFPKMRADIAIFKAMPNGQEPELKLIIEIKKSAIGTSETQGMRYSEILGVPCVYIRGGEEAYKIMEKIQEYL